MFSRKPIASIFVVLAALGFLLYASVPRRVDLRLFDATQLAQLEAAMWRHYYERRSLALLYDLYSLGRILGFSPCESIWIGWNAALAARQFQNSRSADEARNAIPALVEYFHAISRGAPARFDSDAAARAELNWWQARRESLPPEQYGLMIAAVAKLVYGVDNADLRQSGMLRAEAMSHRDKLGLNITDEDWDYITQRLKLSYELLRSAVSR